MLLNIYNLPYTVTCNDIKSLIYSKCGITEVIVDNLVPQENRTKKVTVGLCGEEDAAIFTKNIHGAVIKGHKLRVVSKTKIPTSQPGPLDTMQPHVLPGSAYSQGQNFPLPTQNVPTMVPPPFMDFGTPNTFYPNQSAFYMMNQSTYPSTSSLPNIGYQTVPYGNAGNQGYAQGSWSDNNWNQQQQSEGSRNSPPKKEQEVNWDKGDSKSNNSNLNWDNSKLRRDNSQSRWDSSQSQWNSSNAKCDNSNSKWANSYSQKGNNNSPWETNPAPDRGNSRESRWNNNGGDSNWNSHNDPRPNNSRDSNWQNSRESNRDDTYRSNQRAGASRDRDSPKRKYNRNYSPRPSDNLYEDHVRYSPQDNSPRDNEPRQNRSNCPPRQRSPNDRDRFQSQPRKRERNTQSRKVPDDSIPVHRGSDPLNQRAIQIGRMWRGQFIATKARYIMEDPRFEYDAPNNSKLLSALTSYIKRRVRINFGDDYSMHIYKLEEKYNKIYGFHGDLVALRDSLQKVGGRLLSKVDAGGADNRCRTIKKDKKAKKGDGAVFANMSVDHRNSGSEGSLDAGDQQANIQQGGLQYGGQPQASTSMIGNIQQGPPQQRKPPQQRESQLGGAPQQRGSQFGGAPQQRGSQLGGAPQQQRPQLGGQSQQRESQLGGAPQQRGSQLGGAPQQRGSQLGGAPQQRGSQLGGAPQQRGSQLGGAPQQQRPQLGGQSQQRGSQLGGAPQQRGSQLGGAPQQRGSQLGGAPQQQRLQLGGAPQQQRPQLRGAPQQQRPQLGGAPQQQRPQLGGAPQQQRPQLGGAPQQQRPQLEGQSQQRAAQLGGPPRAEAGSRFGGPQQHGPRFGGPPQKFKFGKKNKGKASTKGNNPSGTPLAMIPGRIPQYPKGDKQLHKQHKKNAREILVSTLSAPMFNSLDAKVKNAIDMEVDLLCTVIDKVCDNPGDDAIPDEFRQMLKGEVSAEMKRVIKVMLARRIIPILPTMLRVYASPPIKRVPLENFLKNYNVCALKKSKKNAYYIVNCNSIEDHDMLCQMNQVSIANSLVSFKPLHLVNARKMPKKNTTPTFPLAEAQNTVKEEIIKVEPITEDVNADHNNDDNMDKSAADVEEKDLCEEMKTLYEQINEEEANDNEENQTCDNEEYKCVGEQSNEEAFQAFQSVQVTESDNITNDVDIDKIMGNPCEETNNKSSAQDEGKIMGNPCEETNKSSAQDEDENEDDSDETMENQHDEVDIDMADVNEEDLEDW